MQWLFYKLHDKLWILGWERLLQWVCWLLSSCVTKSDCYAVPSYLTVITLCSLTLVLIWHQVYFPGPVVIMLGDHRVRGSFRPPPFIVSESPALLTRSCCCVVSHGVYRSFRPAPRCWMFHYVFYWVCGSYRHASLLLLLYHVMWWEFLPGSH